MRRPAPTLRRRLVLSLVAAGALPFAGAVVVAHAAVVAEGRSATLARLDAGVRAAAATIDASVADSRTRARALARDTRVQRALLSRDRAALRAASIAGATIAPVPAARAPWPSVRVVVRASGRPVGVVTVRLPTPRTLLDRAGRAVAAGTGLALVRRGEVIARRGPYPFEPSGGWKTASLPLGALGDVRVLAAVDGGAGGAATSDLRLRLAVAGAVSLAAIVLLALSLARPLLGSLQAVETAALEADVDALTGLANRRLFDRTLERELVRAARTGRPCSLLLIDLDDFKLLNDRYGHEVGDAALRTVGDRLRSHIRIIDLAARIGGEELAVLLPETAATHARLVAERLLDAVRQAEIRNPSGEPLRLTASLGLADSAASRTPEAIMRAADRALYAAKRAGKDRVEVAPAAAPPVVDLSRPTAV